ncbi:hypothetical protein V3C99_011003 [Haemonchus contortus]|uniref:Endo/exonuclease/phosphatase domain-containing protein n=1 Tax=Haemonchus contortus TaxID=6289 RepID=A0A7I4Y5T3_HAECO
MAICTFNARTLASEACIEEMMMQASKIKYDVIGLTETRRHRPLHAVFETGEECSLEYATVEASAAWTWESPGGQFHNEIDHIIFNRRFCLTDVAVIPKFYMGSDHRLLRARFCFSVRGETAMNFRKRRPPSTGTTSLPLRVNERIPLSTTSTKNTTGSSSNFTIVLRKQRVYK